MKKLMIIMLMGIILIIPFNTHAYDSGYQYGLPVYQLDQKIPELNGYTLRQIYEEGQIILNDEFDSPIGWNSYNVVIGSGISKTDDPALYSQIYQNVLTQNNIHYTVIDVIKIENNNLRIYSGGSDITISNSMDTGILSFKYNPLFTNGNLAIRTNPIGYYEIGFVKTYNLTLFNLEHLTKQQLDQYYKYYQLALKYEEDNKEAVKDPGQYKHIFMSIYEGLTNLMRSMGSVWRFLTTPFVDTTLSDMDNLFSIDWSWDIFDVLRQWITNMAVWILQLNAVLIGTLFLILGIPIKVSILSLVFSDLVFVILGWIMIKSFII